MFFNGKKLTLERILGTRWRLFCPTSWHFFCRKPNWVFAQNPTNIYDTFFIKNCYPNSFTVTWRTQFWQLFQTNCQPFAFFPVWIRKSESFSFSKSSYWNWSSGLIEHRLDNSAKFFFARNPPENFTGIPKKNYYITFFLEKKTTIVFLCEQRRPVWEHGFSNCCPDGFPLISQGKLQVY